MPHAQRAPLNYEKKRLPLPLAGEGTGLRRAVAATAAQAGEGGVCWLPLTSILFPRGREEVFSVIF